jgi:P pilus assembly chaperone PapD
MTNLFKKTVISIGLPIFALLFNQCAHAEALGGVSLGATRVIYPINSKQVALPIINHSKKDRYLINAWIDDATEKKTKDFLITPHIFVAEPDTENTLRIVKVIDNLPQDKESIYWINIKSIPSIDKEILETQNTLQLAILSRIKLFIRPNNLPYNSETALEHISFSKTKSGIEVNNQSPYYISFVNINIDAKKATNKMAAPMSKTILSENTGNNITYQTVNDYGALTPKITIKLD